ncbi:hypothetical protein F4818DRAFT_430552 [Hypoxylon cercidicola]|nr:hypothetical protein F4818DRAFT_430552 [Hypoxylon cercidicola]
MPHQQLRDDILDTCPKLADMCHYQDIHAAYHHKHLNLDLTEQKSHTCKHRVLTHEGGDGEKCLLYSCCLLRREVIFQCPGFTEPGQETCDKIYAEIVFVPPETERKENIPGQRLGEKAKHYQSKESEDIDRGALVSLDDAEREMPSSPNMEFWPEDQPGQIVKVYLEDEVPEHGGTSKGESNRSKPETRDS